MYEVHTEEESRTYCSEFVVNLFFPPIAFGLCSVSIFKFLSTTKSMKGNIIMGKSKSKNLTDAICRDLPRLDKRYYKQGDYPGLELWVLTSGKKTWYYQYRTKNKRYPQRKHLGNYPVVGVVEATKKRNKYRNNYSMALIQKNKSKRIL